MSENVYVAMASRSDSTPGFLMVSGGTAEQWQQVLARDARADGVFVYAVRTTGVFCRPSCPSRRPAERNVTFYASPTDARAAGFRACLRCQPDRVERGTNALQQIVARTADVLAVADGEHTSLRALAQATGAGRLQVMRGFRQVLGVTPREFAQGKKVERFTEALQRSRRRSAAKVSGTPESTAGPITEAIYEAGFGSSSRLYERSADAFGMTPRAMLQGGAGKVIRYAASDSPLGRMLVAATDVGVCAIFFGQDDGELVADLRQRYARAELVPSHAEDGWLADAVAYVASQTTEHPLAASFPLDVRATAFQLRVWRALRAIPRGETRTYSDVAREIGRPEAMRAVGAAIGSNPIGVAIPCHRVLGKDGSMTGYRWGIERKKKLLDAEARTRQPEDANAREPHRSE